MRFPDDEETTISKYIDAKTIQGMRDQTDEEDDVRTDVDVGNEVR